MKARWIILAGLGALAAGTAYLFHIGHPFADLLTWEWLRDSLTSVLLIAIAALVGGIAVGRLQDRWARERGKAEKQCDGLDRS